MELGIRLAITGLEVEEYRHVGKFWCGGECNVPAVLVIL